MKMRKQRCMGAVLLTISALLVVLVSTAEGPPEERDAAAALLTAPLGAYLLITPNYILIDGEPAADHQPTDTKGA